VIPVADVRGEGVAERRHRDGRDTRPLGQFGAERGAVGVAEGPRVGAEKVGACAVVDVEADRGQPSSQPIASVSEVQRAMSMNVISEYPTIVSYRTVPPPAGLSSSSAVSWR